MEEHEIDQILVRYYNSAYACAYYSARRQYKKSNKSFEDANKYRQIIKSELLKIAALEKRVAEYEKFLALMVSDKHPLFKNRFGDK